MHPRRTTASVGDASSDQTDLCTSNEGLLVREIEVKPVHRVGLSVAIRRLCCVPRELSLEFSNEGDAFARVRRRAQQDVFWCLDSSEFLKLNYRSE